MAEKEKKTRAKRATLGFQIFEKFEGDEEPPTINYKEACSDKFKSLFETEAFIRKNVAQFKDKTLMIMHIKKELKVSTETKPVAKLEEIN